MGKVVVTGAGGFVGRSLVGALSQLPQWSVTAVSRNAYFGLGDRRVRYMRINAVDGFTCWSSILSGQDVVVHVAAVAHQLGNSRDVLDEYRRVNVDGTLNLARQAIAADVKRFVFISSIGVNGNASSTPFRVADCENPQNPYALSKLEAEKGLASLMSEGRGELVIIRPPMIYGFGAPGNFERLVKLVRLGLPLPFKSLSNRRSFVAIDNLIDLISACLNNPRAAGQVFMVSDGEDISTSEFIKSVANSLGISVRLFSVPPALLWLMARLLGKEAAAQSLLGSLQVDISNAEELLGWTPPVTVQQALERCFDLGEK